MRIKNTSAVLDSHISSQLKLDASTTTGLTFGYKAGYAQGDSANNLIAAGTVTLTDNTINYIYIKNLDIASSTTVPTTFDDMLYRVTTASGAITVIEDLRGIG